jgi:predicted enzyme related to lactoylglutathione lyase
MSVPRFAGTPCWIDLLVPDPAAAAFYGAVLGWTFDDGADMDGYRMARAGGAVVAAIGPGNSDHPRPPGWNVYLHAPDADAAVAVAQAAGGSVLTAPQAHGTSGVVEDSGFDGGWCM